MAKKSYTRELEALCEASVLADLSDLRTVSKLLDGFETLDKLSIKGKQQNVATVCQGCVQRLHDIILENVKDRAGELQKVCATAAQLQQHLRDGTPLVSEFLKDTSPGTSPTPPAPAAQISEAWQRPANVDEKFVADFLSAQPCILDDAEGHILMLSDAEHCAEAMASLRGQLHNLKGESALLAMHSIQQLCHAAEELLVEPLPTGAGDLLLRVVDMIRTLLAFYAGKAAAPQGLDEIKAALQQLSRKPAAATPPPAAPAPSSGTPLAGDAEMLQGFVLECREHLDNADASLLALGGDPTNKEHLDALFRAFHTMKGCAGFLMLDKIQALAHEAESLLDQGRNSVVVLAGPALDAAFEAADHLKEMLEGLQQGLKTGILPDQNPAVPGLLERLRALAAGRAAPAPSAPAAPVVAPEPQAMPATSQPTVPEHVTPPAGTEPPPSDAPRLKLSKIRDAVKVDADRLDRLIDTIGELVISESMVSQSSDLRKSASAQLVRQLGQLDKITRELQEMAMSLRMMPVRATFQKMARLIHDVAKRTGKQCELVTAGEETELDKAVVDGIGDPLVHMIRNAVDHGLEASAADRIKAGKPEKGRVDLRAYHKGGNIYIEVQDDGRGLDRDAILKKAIERNLVRPDEQLSERDIFSLIFLPGFSTAKTVTDVSGRGVGMDVVRKNIEGLRGQVEIQSQPGKGTRFTIRLPLTLAIIDGMVVRVGRERYIVPTLSIVMSLRPQPGAIKSVLNRGEMLSYQGELIPLYRIDRIFGISGAVQRPEDGLVVIVEEDGKRTGLLADSLLGQQQIVIKTLGDSMRGIPGISGGAIMPDGHVGLILDVGALVRISQSTQTQSPAAERVA